ncbi:class I SAM-dependent methyltransferase [Candidatus Omnitrophota bacterium]
MLKNKIYLIYIFFKKVFSHNQYEAIRKLFVHLLSRIYSRNLNELSVLYRTDKRPEYHNYIQYYQKYFHHLRKKKLNILEIGIGEGKRLNKGGGSLRMWKRYFSNSIIYGIDIYDKSFMQEKRIKTFRGDQSDEKFLRNVFDKIGSLDIIIDDGSHINEHVITTFKTLFPLLNNGGIYVIEDTQASYWPEFGGNSENLNSPNTVMNLLKNITDGLNYKEFKKQVYVPTYFDKHITSTHFYHNIAFIFKGKIEE